MSELVTETDPQVTGAKALEVKALKPEAQRTANLVNEFVKQAAQLMSEEEKANMLLLRGFAQMPNLPPMGEVYRLDPAAIAAYPMYRGLATVAGMNVIATGKNFAAEMDTLRANWDKHDFFFIHYKPTDAAGEDGDFDAKVRCLEELDPFIPDILELEPDVLMVAGDHATPAVMAAYSWHPVPFMLHSKMTTGQGVPTFDEQACALGAIGRIPATSVMVLGLSHAGKMNKFGP